MIVFGLDPGLASVGWAVVFLEGENDEIAAAGAFCFEPAEDRKHRTPKNADRRAKRLARRVLRRRALRLRELRTLLAAHRWLASSAPSDIAAIRRELGSERAALDPWEIRRRGLDAPLTKAEFAVAILHLAKRRGFKSNAKGDRSSNTPSEKGMLGSIDANSERLARYRSVAEMVLDDPAFAERRRNRDDYIATMPREAIEQEVQTLFSAQRRLGAVWASESIESSVREIAFRQRPIGDQADKVGPCPFLGPEERRSPKSAPSFERFRFLARLTTLEIVGDGPTRPLRSNELQAAEAQFGATEKFTFLDLRRALGLPSTARFRHVPSAREPGDVVSAKGVSARGTVRLCEAAGAEWAALDDATRDAIAQVVQFKSDLRAISDALSELGLRAESVAAISSAAENGRFDSFSGAAHISAEACRRLIPHLRSGLGYADACAQEGWSHSEDGDLRLDAMASPSAQKACRQALKQLDVMIQRFGAPDRVHVELARDVGRGADERKEIELGIERRTKERNAAREKMQHDLGLERAATDVELLRRELWLEQRGRCLFCDEALAPNAVLSGRGVAEIEHILPLGRFQDDSFHNKTLACVRCNRMKRNRTPKEWFDADRGPDEWSAYRRRVEELPGKRKGASSSGGAGMPGLKKRNLLLEDAADRESEIARRSLNDTRYASRVLAAEIRRRLQVEESDRTEDGKRRVFVRPGAITAKLRRAWGLDGLKKDETGARRRDDRHHALDAIVVAATTERTLQQLTRAIQDAERRGVERTFETMPEPWPGFRDQAKTAVESVFVARMEIRRGRGEAHEASIRGMKAPPPDDPKGKPLLFERKPIDKLEVADLNRISDPDRNAPLIERLRTWLETKPKPTTPPLSPQGDPIRKVRLLMKATPALTMSGGAIAKLPIVRLDIYERLVKSGARRYVAVPVYRPQLVTLAQPPAEDHKGRALQADDRFLFSLFSNSWLKVEVDNQTREVYFRSFDKNTGAVTLSRHYSTEETKGLKGIGLFSADSLRKYVVDRWGCRALVPRETLTWRGQTWDQPWPPASESPQNST